MTNTAFCLSSFSSRSFLAIAVFLIAVTGCNTKAAKENPGLPGYNLDQPDKMNMGESLLEISGISFHNGSPDTIYSIQDEEGKLFHFGWKADKKWHTKFGKNGDYEDVSVMREKVYVLKSNGVIYSFPFADAIYEEIDSTEQWTDILPKGEYESLYGDETTGLLYVLCKNCKGESGKETLSGYIFSTEGGIKQTGNFQIDVDAIKPFSGKVKNGFRPSALAFSPRTKEWYIVSAVNKLLVVTDVQWKVKGAYPLNGNMFNQPEGIAFDNAGNLYISNEGDDISPGNVLKFQRH